MCGMEVKVPLALEVGVAQQMDQRQVRPKAQREALPRVFQKAQLMEQPAIQAMVNVRREVQPTEQRGDRGDKQGLVAVGVS